MSVSYFTQELCNCVISKMASHFGFCPLVELAHTFGSGTGAHFFLNTPKYQNPSSNEFMLSMVTGVLDMTLLYCFVCEVDGGMSWKR